MVMVVQEEIPNDNVLEVINDCIKRLKKIQLTKELENLKHNLADNLISKETLQKIQMINNELKNL